MKTCTAQEAYLKKQLKEKHQVRFLRIFILLAFLSIWQCASDFGWIDSFIFSSPVQVIQTFYDMMKDHSLPVHVGVTLAETLISFALTILFTVLTAILLWVFPRFAAVSEPYFIVLNSLPKSALAPLLIVWLGANMKTIVIAGMSVAIFGSIISLYQGFQEVGQEKMKLIYTLGGKKHQVLTKVVLPASTPYLLSILKVDIGLCLVGVIIGEFIGARRGLGYLIIYSSQVFKLNWLILSIVILCVIAMVLYQGLCLLEKWYSNRK
ncbi:ABC transporter permease [Novisyntrophococcus fermenticellae]|uniref:ABC transporter permease n=1 Tax=Novisyntrophococcus fermenticellae TaxID=2068655 RepID=UPI001E38F450|nr:ABC transporter permease [Novisyntrophococcus fermenticellae]